LRVWRLKILLEASSIVATLSWNNRRRSC
jgi:hypothetical protein